MTVGKYGKISSCSIPSRNTSIAISAFSETLTFKSPMWLIMAGIKTAWYSKISGTKCSEKKHNALIAAPLTYGASC